MQLSIDFEEFITCFNEYGKSAARKLAKDKYNKSYEMIQRIIRCNSPYCFDRHERKYKLKDNTNVVDANFMTIDEIETRHKESIIETNLDTNKESFPKSSFDKILEEMIKDRLMELSKYISIDHGTNRVLLNSKKIKIDGFSLEVI